MAKKDVVSAKALNEVRSFVNELSGPLHLSGWTFDVEADNDEEPVAIAVIHCMDEYMRAVIQITPLYQTLDLSDRFEAITHELFHSVLVPMYRGGSQAAHKDWERVTSHVTAIFLGQYRRRRRKPRATA